MCFDDAHLESSWNPWSSIPEEFNLGEALTRGQVLAGRGGEVAIHWENAARASRSFSYSELDVASSRLASSLQRLGLDRGDRVFLRLPVGERPECGKVGPLDYPAQSRPLRVLGDGDRERALSVAAAAGDRRSGGRS